MVPIGAAGAELVAERVCAQVWLSRYAAVPVLLVGHVHGDDDALTAVHHHSMDHARSRGESLVARTSIARAVRASARHDEREPSARLPRQHGAQCWRHNYHYYHYIGWCHTRSYTCRSCSCYFQIIIIVIELADFINNNINLNNRIYSRPKLSRSPHARSFCTSTRT